MTKNQIIIASAVTLVLVGIIYFVFMRGNLKDIIAFPYIAHQKPLVDPHLPTSAELADKLDEVIFDGLFNISANPSGITYEDGLASFVSIDENSVVTLKLNVSKKWSDSYIVSQEEDEISIIEGETNFFNAEDLRFTLKRILNLGSLSPDFILVSQALETINFDGPDNSNMIRFDFKDDRIWVEPDIKEVLSFKILPANSPINSIQYRVGTAEYLAIPSETGVSNYFKTPHGVANIKNVFLKPYIDNSTFTTELNNNNINVVLDIPFGGISPILNDAEDFFYKSSNPTTFFAILFNTQKIPLNQRRELKKLINNKQVLDRFFKVGTEQQRNIVDFKGNKNNYIDYLNNSVFPSSSYYVEDSVVVPYLDRSQIDFYNLPDTLRIQTCTNYGNREELNEIIEILNDPNLYNGKIKVISVTNDELKKVNYDALLVPFKGYRSNFLFDLYNVFMRQPDLDVYKINLDVVNAGTKEEQARLDTWRTGSNFCNIDFTKMNENREDFATLLEYIHGFMSTNMLGDKQAYAERIDRIENDLALGVWLFSLPSLSYFSTQFDSTSIDLYGVASQLSTIEKWKEKKDR